MIASRAMKARTVGTVIAFVLVAAFAGGAAAQPTLAAPDVVRLRDGGLLRGTIAELVAGNHVTIVVVTGETRRVAAADFTFAGPVEEAPRATPTTTAVIPQPPAVDTPPPPSAAPATSTVPVASRARVRFRTREGERIVVDAASETSGTPSYARVCTTPCATTIPIGAYHVALTRRGFPRLTVEHLLPIEDRDLVTVEYETRGGTRFGGYVVIGVTAAAGIGIALAPFAADERSRDGLFAPAIVGGVAIAAIGVLIGLLMHGTDDAAHASVKHHEDEDDYSDDDDDDE